MAEILKMSDLDQGVLAFDLPELLALVGDDLGPNLVWRIFPMGEGTEMYTFDEATASTIRKLGDKVDASQDGVEKS